MKLPREHCACCTQFLRITCELKQAARVCRLTIDAQLSQIQREVAKYKPQHLLLCGGVVPYAAFGYPEMTEADYATLLPASCAVQ